MRSRGLEKLKSRGFTTIAREKAKMVGDLKQYVHVALIGAVSVGKSTLLNAILTTRAAPMAMIRSTAGETVYCESTDSKKSDVRFAQCYDAIKTRDAKLMKDCAAGKQFAIGDIRSEKADIPLITGLIDGVHKRDALLMIHDLPGLNDGPTKLVYHEYVKSRFHEFDVVLFIVDVQSGMNTSDEKDILTLIINGMKSRRDTYGAETKLIIVINKCDEMQTDAMLGMVPADQERRDMVIQTHSIINNAFANVSGLGCVGVKKVCLSAEDAYVYRMFQHDPKCTIDENHRNKFGTNEFGKTRWMKMKQDEKDSRITEWLKTNSDTGIELSGWNVFGRVLCDAIDYQFMLNCATVQIKRDLRPMLATFTAEYLGVTNSRFRALGQGIGLLLSDLESVRGIYRFLLTKVYPCYEKYAEFTLAKEWKIQHDAWFTTELTQCIRQIAAPNTLRGQNGITDTKTFQLAVDVKHIYVFLRDSMPRWYSSVTADQFVGSIDSELLAFLYKEVFNPLINMDMIIANLVLIDAIDPKSNAAQANYVDGIPYRICAKICEYKFVRDTVPALMGDVIMMSIDRVLGRYNSKSLAPLVILREVIPWLEKGLTITINYSRIVATIDLFFLNMTVANQYAQDAIDYIIACKARALTGASRFGRPGQDDTIWELAMYALTQLATMYPLVFVNIGKCFVMQSITPPTYASAATDEVKK